MTERVIIAGAGGQGIMLVGKILAEAAMQEDKSVTWLPAYGAEVRGGSAYCMVIISDDEIGSPYIKEADALISLNTLSLNRFKNRVKTNGLCILNSSFDTAGLGNKTNVLKYPFSDIAIKLGNIKVANMVALGCYLERKKIVKSDTIFEIIKKNAPADKQGLIEINRQAYLAGARLLR